MPRFYFDVRRANVVHPDHDGVHLPTIAVARAEAARAAVDMMRETVPADTPEITLAVRDEHGELLFEVQALVQIRKH